MNIKNIFKKENNEYFLKGITEKTQIPTSTITTNLNNDIGEPHPFNYELTEELYKTYGFVTGVIDKFVDFVWGSGFYVKSKNKKAEKIITDWLHDSNFDSTGRKWLRESLIKGTGYIDIDKNKDGIIIPKAVNSNHFFIKRDKYGELIGYTQYVPRSGMNKELKEFFKPSQLAHLNINEIGSCAYGYGIIFPTIKTINNLLGCEKDMHKLINRKANTPVIVSVGNAERGELPTEGVIDDVKNSVQSMNNSTEWVLSDGIKISTVDFGKVGEKFDSVLQYDKDLLISAFQVPEVLLGKGNIPEGLAKVQMDAFLKRVQSIQTEIERIIETRIINIILNSQGIDASVEFEWGEQDLTEKNERISQITVLLNNVMLSQNVRDSLENELISLMGLDIQKSANVERDEEENDELPKLPGANELFESVKKDDNNKIFCVNCKKITESTELIPYAKYECNKCKHINEVTNVQLKEWIGFDYSKFLKNIQKSIDEDTFEQLKANSPSEVKDGKLSPSQINELKKVLKTAFIKGKSIKDLKNEILEKVNIRDLKLMNENGTEIIIPAEKRSINIARTETIKASNEGSRITYKEQGVQKYRWVASTGGRTCPVCESLNGQVFNIKESPNPYNGEGSNIPPAHTMCRCSIVPLTELDNL